jgi:hypothetical protein
LTSVRELKSPSIMTNPDELNAKPEQSPVERTEGLGARHS